MELEILSGRVATLEKLVIQLAKWVNFDVSSSKQFGPVARSDSHQYNQKQKSTRQPLTTTVATPSKRVRLSSTAQRELQDAGSDQIDVQESDIDIKIEEDAFNTSEDFILDDIPQEEDTDEFEIQPAPFQLNSDDDYNPTTDSSDEDYVAERKPSTSRKRARAEPSQKDLDELATADFKILKTRKGKPMIALDGMLYGFSKMGGNGSKRYWICGDSRITKCCGRLHTTMDLEDLKLICTLGTQEYLDKMATVPFKLLKTSKGKPMIALNGFLHGFSKMGGGKRYWICCDHRKTKCCGRLHTTMDLEDLKLIAILGTHSHPPNPDRIQLNEAMTKIREEAQSSDANPGEIISKIISTCQLSSSNLKNLPNRDNMRRLIKNARVKAGGGVGDISKDQHDVL